MNNKTDDKERLLDDTASSTEYEKIKEIFNGLSDYEADIMERILSYNIDLEESDCNGLVVERLRRDNLDAHVCNTEWEAVRCYGERYIATHSFIEIVNGRGNKEAEQKLIVDLKFQFEFASFPAKPEYRRMCSYLPNIFVGTEEKLRRIIAITFSFAGERALHWTKPDFLHSKWSLSPDRKIQP